MTASFLIRQFWLILVFGRVAGLCGEADDIETRIHRVETGLPPAMVITNRPRDRFKIEERMRFYKTPGVSVAVINGGKIEWARGYGSMEAGAASPVTTETPFQAASISKALTAMTVMRLVQAGRLNLDDDVNEKLVSWKVPENDFTRTRKVTLRELLSHSSGVVDPADFQGFASNEEFPSLVDILDGAKPNLPGPIRVQFVPGSTWRYSNGAYCIVELLLTDVTRRSFPSLAREQVLDPLMMKNSSFEQPLPPDRAKYAAAGHRLDGLPVKGKRLSLPEAVGGLWTTPSDLARFAIAIQDAVAGKSTNVLSQEIANQMVTKQSADWGLGLGIDSNGSATRFYHSGSVGGFECSLDAFLGTGQGAVVMTNGSQGWRLTREILWSIAQEYGWPDYPYDPEIKNIVPVSPETLAHYAGRYQRDQTLSSGGTVIVTAEQEHLFAEAANEPGRVELFPISETTYFALEDDLEVTFVEDGSGSTEMFSNQTWQATKVQSN